MPMMMNRSLPSRLESSTALRVLIWLCLSCLTGRAQAATLTVAVAANVQYAFEELSSAYVRQTGDHVRTVVASSGKLAAQIMHGSPVDVFLSADMDYPDKLHRAGHTAEPPRIYAYGTLVLWTMQPELDLDNWQVTLASDRVRRIAIANPRLAPYGSEAMKALAHAGLAHAVRRKLVYGESVSQVNQYIHSRAVDAGVTAKAVVLAPMMRDQGYWVELPRDAYTPIAQGLLVLRHGDQHNQEAAHRFRDFMFSPTARHILARYGYTLP